MNKVIKWVSSVFTALGILIVAGITFAAPAQALNIYEKSYLRCPNWVDVYDFYDYNAWEESWFGGSHRDKLVYKRTYYKYLGPTICGNWAPR